MTDIDSFEQDSHSLACPRAEDFETFAGIIKTIVVGQETYNRYVIDSELYQKRQLLFSKLPPSHQTASLRQGLAKAKETYELSKKSFSMTGAMFSTQLSWKIYNAFTRAAQQQEANTKATNTVLDTLTRFCDRQTKKYVKTLSKQLMMKEDGSPVSRSDINTMLSGLKARLMMGDGVNNSLAEAGKVAMQEAEAETKAGQKRLKRKLDQIQDNMVELQMEYANRLLIEAFVYAWEKSTAFDIDKHVGDAVNKVMEEILERIDPIDRVLQSSKKLRTIHTEIENADALLTGAMKRPENMKETMLHTIAHTHRELQDLAADVTRFKERNEVIQTEYIAQRLGKLEKTCRTVEAHLDRLKESVLRPGFGERIDSILNEFNEVMSNHGDYIRYLVDPIASLENEYIGEKHLKAVTSHGPLSYPLQNAVEKLTAEAVSSVLDKASQRVDLLEKSL